MKTSLYTILCIVVRFGAILLMAGTVVAMPNLYFVGHTIGIGSDTAPLMTLLYLASLIVAFVLWLYPNVLVSLVSGRTAKEVFEISIGAHTIQYVAFSVLGVWLMLKGAIALVFEIFRWATLSTLPQVAGVGLLTSELPRFASAGAQIFFGVVLALGAKGLIVLLQCIRYGNGTWEES
ncbi:MAG: hypothetical protein ABI132_08105 [Rhodanobacteraceae bacterium]